MSFKRPSKFHFHAYIIDSVNLLAYTVYLLLGTDACLMETSLAWQYLYLSLDICKHHLFKLIVVYC